MRVRAICGSLAKLQPCHKLPSKVSGRFFSSSQCPPRACAMAFPGRIFPSLTGNARKNLTGDGHEPVTTALPHIRYPASPQPGRGFAVADPDKDTQTSMHGGDVKCARIQDGVHEVTRQLRPSARPPWTRHSPRIRFNRHERIGLGRNVRNRRLRRAQSMPLVRD
jgi:hypothetical protein